MTLHPVLPHPASPGRVGRCPATGVVFGSRARKNGLDGKTKRICTRFPLATACPENPLDLHQAICVGRFSQDSLRESFRVHMHFKLPFRVEKAALLDCARGPGIVLRTYSDCSNNPDLTRRRRLSPPLLFRRSSRAGAAPPRHRTTRFSSTPVAPAPRLRPAAGRTRRALPRPTP